MMDTFSHYQESKEGENPWGLEIETVQVKNYQGRHKINAVHGQVYVKEQSSVLRG